MKISTKIYLIVLLFVITTLPKILYSQNQKSNQPDEQISINKEYDNNGNITRYDSTYSWTWSNNGNQNINDSMSVKIPDIFNDKFFFDNQFNNQFNILNDTIFFGSDSMFNNFEKQMQKMFKYQQQIINEMQKQVPENYQQKNENLYIEPKQNKSQNKGIDL